MKKQSVVKKFLYSQKVAPYVFVMPFILTFAIFFAYSIVSMILMSFQKVAGANTTFIGLENYKILTNAVFLKSLKNSIFYTIVTCIMMIPIPMILAAMLNSKHMRAKGTFRSILFIPALTSVVVAGVVFRLMFGELEGSFMNQVMNLFGVEPIIWLRKPVTVWITLFFLCLWRWTGVNMMYYLSGLQQIPADLYESASIDGATGFQKFVSITIPLLKSTIMSVLVLGFVLTFKVFDLVYVMTGGGPVDATEVLSTYSYKLSFELFHFG